MQYELWARSRETKKDHMLAIFYDEIQKYYMIDTVDQDLYQDAMVLKTEWQQQPECVMYVEFPKPKVLRKIPPKAR